MADKANENKDPRHHELSEGKGYSASNVEPYRVTDSSKQVEDNSEKPKFF